MKTGRTIHDERYKALVQSLAEERVRLGISQLEIATQIGLRQSDISKIEKAERRMDVLEFSLYLSALRIDTNEQLQNIVIEFLGISK